MISGSDISLPLAYGVNTSSLVLYFSIKHEISNPSHFTVSTDELHTIRNFVNFDYLILEFYCVIQAGLKLMIFLLHSPE